jgi:hypothetical protein
VWQADARWGGDTQVRTQFDPGHHTALVGERLVVLLSVPSDTPVVAALRSWVEHDASVEEVLEVLVSHGLRKVPHAAIARAESDGLRVVARGDAVITDRLRTWSVDGTAVSTWSERMVASCASIEMRLGGELGELGYWCGQGVVPTNAVRWVLDEEADATAGLLGIDLSEEADDPGEGHKSDEANESDEVGDVSSFDDASGVEPEPVTMPEPEQQEVPQLAADTAVELLGHRDVDPLDDRTILGVDIEAALRSESDSLTTSGPVDDGYDHLFGATRALSVEGAAKRPVAEDDGPHPTPFAAPLPASVYERPGSSPVGIPPRPIVTTGHHKVTPAPAPIPGMIESIPGLPRSPTPVDPPANPAVPAHGSDFSDLHDGHTVTMAELRKLQQASGGSLSGAVPVKRTDGPVVQAIACQGAHFNPPQARVCRVCGMALGSEDPVTVPRPPLGTLRFSTGDVVVLDRPVLVGRSPVSSGPVNGEEPHLVLVPSPDQDISRTHLEVRIDGWHVLVLDRRSTNGTTVTLPGQVPQRLHPMEPFLIATGAVVTLGDEATFTFEAGA